MPAAIGDSRCFGFGCRDPPARRPRVLLENVGNFMGEERAAALLVRSKSPTSKIDIASDRQRVRPVPPRETRSARGIVQTDIGKQSLKLFLKGGPDMRRKGPTEITDRMGDPVAENPFLLIGVS